MRPLDGTAVCEILRGLFAGAPQPQALMQLTGRFAAEVMHHPTSDFSRLIRAEILDRGHHLRMLTGRTTTPETGARALLGGALARQVHLRVTDAPLPDLAFVSPDLTLVRAAGPEGQPQILLAHREATAALHQFQQVLWGHARDLLPPPRAARPLNLDDTQLEVLRMLGSGMKDDTAARQMNLSVRTYRRHVAAILKSLDVNTRFEAGLKAATLGLLGRS
ncbi:LuxR C-terminal-related transcriptional regulator [Streptomyces sp. NPDC050803]|uniref:helix-turn-helix transcriptional regulator n=1 Tax=unclassified Streptomyces TaxID=2593676 RepID=UPI00342258AD